MCVVENESPNRFLAMKKFESFFFLFCELYGYLLNVYIVLGHEEI